MATKAKSEAAEISILEMRRTKMDFCVLGVTPLIQHRLVLKTAGRDLLVGSQKKTAVERASTAKHGPLRECRESPYTIRDPKAPTLIAGLSTWFKGAMKTAALDTPGAK